MLWDKPASTGWPASARTADGSSDFNSGPKAEGARRQVLNACDARYCSGPSMTRATSIGAAWRRCFPRGARVSDPPPRPAIRRSPVGIYNPQGEKVGRVGRLHNNELPVPGGHVPVDRRARGSRPARVGAPVVCGAEAPVASAAPECIE